MRNLLIILFFPFLAHGQTYVASSPSPANFVAHGFIAGTVGYVANNTPTVFDVDAQKYIDSAGITNLGLQTAINTLVIGLKNNSLWTKLYAAYPFITDISGNNTASLDQMKWNLKNPVNSDAAFRLLYTGTPLADSSGITWNGINTFADTRLRPSTTLTLNSNSFGLYIAGANIFAFQTDMGVTDFVTGTTFMELGLTNDNLEYGCYLDPDVSTLQASSSGNWIGSRTASNALASYKNGNTTPVATSTNISSELPTHRNIFIGARNSGGAGQRFSSKRFTFLFIAQGLTSTDVGNISPLLNSFNGSVEIAQGMSVNYRKVY